MALTVSRLSDTVIEIKGFKPEARERVLRQAQTAAAEVQFQIADDFEGEQAAGGHLFRNSRKYTVDKIIRGFDPRRGHRTGKLQRELWRPGLVKVDAQSRRILLVLLRDTLLGRVSYSDRYAEAKVRGGNILRVYPALVQLVRQIMSGVSREAERGDDEGTRAITVTRRSNVLARVIETLGSFFGVAA